MDTIDTEESRMLSCRIEDLRIEHDVIHRGPPSGLEMIYRSSVGFSA